MPNWIKRIINAFKSKPKSLVSKSSSKIETKLPSAEKPTTTGLGQEWYPGRTVTLQKMRTRGKYTGGYPKGAVVHFTAGRYAGGVRDAINAIDLGIKNGYAYNCIDSDGKVLQAHPMSEWGYHAGESKWNGLAGAVSDDLIGIEMCNAGEVTEQKDGTFKTWFGTTLLRSEVRYVGSDYGCPPGYYHKYTAAQEKALIDLLVWMKKNDKTGQFKTDYILGHHEVAGKLGIGFWRKSDPGGALSMTMPQLRALVKEKAGA